MRLCSVLVLSALAGAGCGLLPGTGPGPKVSGTNAGNGAVTVNGQPKTYTINPDDTRLLLLVKKKNGASCAFFHHHAMSALSVGYAFALDRDQPGQSTLTATVYSAGLDPDQDSYRAAFSETRGSSFTGAERRDIRTNMLNQVDAAHFPEMSFAATHLSTLDGSGTADVSVNLKGRTSTLTMQATAQWQGDTLVLDGTGTLDGSAHGLPTGTFSDCVDSQMGLLMHISFKPGQGSAVVVPDAGTLPSDQRQFFPDTAPCAAVGFPDVQDILAVRCAGCHGDPLRNGATAPLMTWRDLHTDSVLFPGQPLYLDMGDRITDPGGRHMPPRDATQPTPEEVQKLLAWVHGGGNEHTCGADGGVALPADGGTTTHSGLTAACGSPAYAEVAPVFAQNCTSCHSAAGGEAALDSYAAGLVPVSHPAYQPLNRWQAAHARMVDQSMPPGGGLNGSPVDLVGRWVAAGVPEFPCDGDGGVTIPDAGPPPLPTCTSNTYWTRGDHPSGSMHPGRDCLGCHAANDGPAFTAAGTVMGGLHDADDCNGSAGLVVTLTGADGNQVTMLSNGAGNFHSYQPVAPPYTAQVRNPATGATHQMSTPQMETSCNACHSVAGVNRAPGRILAP